MAYRRKHGPQRSLTFIEDTRSSSAAGEDSSLPSPQLVAHAIRASALHRDSSSLSPAYAHPPDPGAHPPETGAHHNTKHLARSATYATPKDAMTYEYTSMKSLNETKYGFWGVLARKAKSILEDDNAPQQFEDHGGSHLQMPDTSAAGGQFNQPNLSPDSYERSLNTKFASSLHHIGGTIKNALEEGLTIVENRTADITQETRKLQIRRKSGSFSAQNQPTDLSASNYLYPNLNDYETQLKASRDVANAMATKAKLLLRELKTVKADLTFAKERCAQLEEENKLLRECRDKGDTLEDDDLIRLQLETLLEEKGRLAHENSIYSRENRFLREIVEYHQLTMQDVVYVNEGIEEVEEVCPIQLPAHLASHTSPGRLSPIISRGGSPSNSSHSSPRSNSNHSSPRSISNHSSPRRNPRHHDDAPKLFLTAGSASPSSPSSPKLFKAETESGSSSSSPKSNSSRRQSSPTPA